jgi:hypothetical protein
MNTRPVPHPATPPSSLELWEGGEASAVLMWCREEAVLTYMCFPSARYHSANPFYRNVIPSREGPSLPLHNLLWDRR